MPRFAIAIGVLFLANATSFAHYNMLLPDKPWANKDEKVTFTYQFGHPFEHELFDAPMPVSLIALLPSRRVSVFNVGKALTRIELPGANGKKVTAWRFEYTPIERGDHVFVLKTRPINLDEGHAIEDIVKVVLHVQTQNGWDRDLRGVAKNERNDLDLVPLTRPYGLLPGMVFKGQALYMGLEKARGAPAAPFASGLKVEIEKYNPKPMKDLPPDELITFATKTDAHGTFVTTLPDPGWWAITAIDHAATKTVQRVTLWVHVNEKK